MSDQIDPEMQEITRQLLEMRMGESKDWSDVKNVIAFVKAMRTEAAKLYGPPTAATRIAVVLAAARYLAATAVLMKIDRATLCHLIDHSYDMIEQIIDGRAV